MTDLFDPFKFDHGMEYGVQFQRRDDKKWNNAMEWVTHETAIKNAKQMVSEGFMSAVRVVRLSRYPPWSVQSVHYYWEHK